MNKNHRAKLLHALLNIEKCNNNLLKASEINKDLNKDAIELMQAVNINLKDHIYKMLKAKEPAKLSLPVALELPKFLNYSHN